MVGISSKQLILSISNLTYSADKMSPTFTAASPDGYSICSPSSEPGSLTVGWTYGNRCGTTIAVNVVGPASPGTYTVRFFVTTENKVWNGKYISYKGEVTVVITPSVSFTLSVAAPQYSTYQSGGTYALSIPVSVVKGGAYSGSPVVAPHIPDSAICATQNMLQTGPNTYIWSCVLSSYGANGIHAWTMTFQGNDGTITRDATRSVSY